jgi:hypothetical protein
MMYNRYLHCRNYGFLQVADEAKTVSPSGPIAVSQMRTTNAVVPADDSISEAVGDTMTEMDAMSKRSLYKRNSMFNIQDNACTLLPLNEQDTPPQTRRQSVSCPAGTRSIMQPFQAQISAMTQVPLGPSLDDYNVKVGNAAQQQTQLNRRQSMRSRDIVKFDMDDLPNDLLDSNPQSTRKEILDIGDDSTENTVVTASTRPTVTRKPSVSKPRTNKAAVLRRASSYGEFVPAPSVEPFASKRFKFVGIVY